MTITEFPLPAPNGGDSFPWGIAAGPDGNVWFTEQGPVAIGRITPTGAITEFPIPSEVRVPGQPGGIVAGPDGSLWFTENPGDVAIGRITPGGTITEFQIPTPSVAALAWITAGPDGNLWFTEDGPSRIGRITPNGTATEFALPNPEDVPERIAAGPDGNVWFTGTTLGRITPSGTITEFPIADPDGIAAGPDGNIWFTAPGNIGRITPNGTITEFAAPLAGAIAAGPDGNMWFIGDDTIGRITLTGTVTEFPIPTPNSGPTNIAAGFDGTLWFTETTANKIARVSLGGLGLAVTTTSLPAATVGQSYSATLAASGGTPPYSWSLAPANVPTGTSLDSASGSISGSPSIVGTYNFTATAEDSSSPPQTASAPVSIAVNPSAPQQSWTVDGNGVGMLNPPHVAFVLVGDWWCAVTGIGSGSLCTFKKGYPYKCPQYATCQGEGRDLEAAENALVQLDYSSSSSYFQQLQKWYCDPAADCSGQSLVRRSYNGRAFYGPVSEKQAGLSSRNPAPGPFLNSLASGFGISSQTDASNTVFVFLLPPDDACIYANFNSQAPGKQHQYGFVYAEVVMEDYARSCNGPTGTVVGGDLNQQSPEPISPEQFATYATSHEIDEAITSPGSATGWKVPSVGGQLADPCTNRTQSGDSLGYDSPANGKKWPYYNFTRDSFGTVVAAFVQFSSSRTCYPDVSTTVPPG